MDAGRYYCTAASLDVSHRRLTRHASLLYKIKMLPIRSVCNRKIVSGTKKKFRHRYGEAVKQLEEIDKAACWDRCSICYTPQIFQLPWIPHNCNLCGRHNYSGDSQQPYGSIPAFTRKPLLHSEMTKGMENQSKICIGDIHHPQRDVPTGNLERIEEFSSQRH